ncbi:MAG: hypothetical protein ABJA67_15810, partial [Chthonomonadales bacterium]
GKMIGGASYAAGPAASTAGRFASNIGNRLFHVRTKMQNYAKSNGLNHISSMKITRERPGPNPGQTLSNTSYNHTMEAPDSHAAAHRLWKKMSGLHNMSSVKKGAGEASFSATHKITGEQHNFRFVDGMPAPSMPKPAQPAPTEPMGKPASVPKVSIKMNRTSGTVPSPTMPGETHGSHIIGTANTIRATHISSGVIPSRKGKEREVHLFHHRTPMLAAKKMQVMTSATHKVSPIVTRRGNSGGKVRHQYSFNATPIGGGPTQTISFHNGR